MFDRHFILHLDVHLNDRCQIFLRSEGRNTGEYIFFFLTYCHVFHYFYFHKEWLLGVEIPHYYRRYDRCILYPTWIVW